MLFQKPKTQTPFLPFLYLKATCPMPILITRNTSQCTRLQIRCRTSVVPYHTCLILLLWTKSQHSRLHKREKREKGYPRLHVSVKKSSWFPSLDTQILYGGLVKYTRDTSPCDSANSFTSNIHQIYMFFLCYKKNICKSASTLEQAARPARRQVIKSRPTKTLPLCQA